MFFDALVLGLLALYRMWCMDRRMTMLALIPAAFMFAIGTVMGKTMTKTWEKRQQAFSDLSDFAQENFSGIAVIKAFVKELKELIAFRKLNKDNEEVNVEYTRISVLLEVMVTFFVESVICVILGYGGYLVYKGDFNAGQLVEYIGYFEAIVWPSWRSRCSSKRPPAAKPPSTASPSCWTHPLMWPTAPVCRTSKTQRAALSSAI